MNWWQQGVFYQIYPRSFQDSNADGIGDLRGLIQRLDYLNDGTEQSLGIDAIWLSPIFPSPMHDFGYDISDYCAIDPVFGSMETFDELLQQAHQRNIRIILDLVVNHTSDQHPWFQQSCAADSDKADWYIWHQGEQPPNNWLGCFGGRGWTFHPQRNAWYYHSFLPQQPDLNWRNPAVKQAVRQIMEFWLNKGVDGFRLDVVNLYFKDARLRNNPTDWFRLARPYDRQRHIYDRDQPEMHSLLHDMRRWVDAFPQRMMVGEIMLAEAGNSDLPASYYGQNDELHLAFNFEFLRAPFKASAFHSIIQKWMDLLGDDNWPNYTLSNHDFRRHASRYRDGKHTLARLKVLATLLLTLRGTPFLYYGEEIAMPEQKVKRRDLKDPVGIRYWPLHPGRDGCRRPMMWDAPVNRFTQGLSWLPDEPIVSNSAEHQRHDPHSLLNWYKKLIWLRKKIPALHQGSLRLLQAPDDVLAYERSAINANAGERLLILLNFSRQPQLTSLHPQALASCLLNSLQQDTAPQDHNSALTFQRGQLQLQPLQALVLQLQADYPLKVYV
ncbi:MAG: alpha-glucosidase [Saccharospirillaceae bacterium]|nr:alpha-glucosidase [Saccharospirillaceae bacterium]MCD8531600.1 alpha-glucosidase [Saccharospirillaceae bacterium]